jgi:hypothetical protein
MVSKYFGQICAFILLSTCAQISLIGQNRSDLKKDQNGKQIVVGTSEQDRQVSTTIYYRVLETSNDLNFAGNHARLDSLATWIDSIKTNTKAQIKSIRIIGYASPEGNEEQNAKLAKERAQNIADFIKGIAPEMANKMTVTSEGSDWNSVLDNIAASNLAGKEKILDIIKNEPVTSIINGHTRYIRKEKLFLIDGGKTYRYIVDNFYGNLRRTEVWIDFVEEKNVTATINDVKINDEKIVDHNEPVKMDTAKVEVPMVIDTTVTTHAHSVAPISFVRVPLIAVKTNLLYDAATVLNVAVEVPIGKHWSAGLDYKFPWWVWDNNSRALEILHWDGYARYWFGNRSDKRVLTGLFAGAMIGGGYYDLEPHHKGYQGEFYTASAEGGYAFRISDHWSFELSAALGWMGTKYRYYEGMQNDQHLVWQHSGHYTWIGPTKVNASIVYLFYHKVNKGATK